MNPVLTYGAPDRANRLGHVGYVAAAVVILVIGWAWHALAERTRASATAVDHTLQVLQAIALVNEAVGRAESANRGHALYGTRTFLEERERALEDLHAQADRLASLTGDNAAQQVRAARLRKLLEERSRVMRDAEAAPEGASLLTESIYALSDEVRTQELSLLAARRQEHQEQHQLGNRVLLASMVVALGVLVPGYLAFMREARARWRAQRQLVELAESLPGVVFQFRSQGEGRGRYEFMTSNAERLWGVSRRAALADPRAIIDAIEPEDRSALRAAIAEGERTLTPVEVDYRVRMPGGETRWIRTTAAPRRTSDGSVLWSGHWGDVTEKVALARELRESKDAAEAAANAKSVFLATMSHEIRTPMNGILGMLELLSLTRLAPEQRTNLEIVRESGKTLLRIIDDILDFTRIEAGKLAIVPQPASIAAIVARVRNIYSGNASSRGLLLRDELDPAIRPALMIDPVRVQQVLGNLVSNAIKFSDDGEVVIGARLLQRTAEADHVELYVRDTGIGISASDQARLFEPFQQAREMPGGRHPGGTGLGLSICRRLAAMMDASLEMQSAVGAGTVVRMAVWFPVATEAPRVREGEFPAGLPAPTEAIPERGVPSIQEAARRGSLVLVVDDHPINRLVLLRQVNALGYAAETSENGLEAIERWRTGQVALILTDCNMPEMNGYDLARHVRRCEDRERRRRTPIVACTANALGGEAEKCLASGMDDYLAKPFDLKTLRHKLESWLPLEAVQEAARVAPPPDAATESPILVSVLAEASGGDPELELQILRRFMEFNAGDVGTLLAAVESADADAVRQAAHRIKGAAKTVGSLAYAAVCDRIERAARGADWGAIRTHLPAFQHELARLEQYATSLPA